MVLVIISFTSFGYATSPGGINEDLGAFTFHTESDNNPALSYGSNSSTYSTTVDKNTTIDPIEKYENKASDWNINIGPDPDLPRTWITNTTDTQ